MVIRFNKTYGLLAIILFSSEVAIAYFFKTGFIRHFMGDVLVVVLIFTFVKTFFDLDNFKLALGVLLFAFSIEIAQYFNIVDILGLGENKLARIIIGTTFVWSDLFAYLIGAIASFLSANQYER